MLKKIKKITFYVFLVLFCIALIITLQESSRGEDLTGPLVFTFILGVPLWFVLFNRLEKAVYRTYLKRFAGYTDLDMEGMGASELKKRRELFRADKAGDYRHLKREELQPEIKRVKAEQKAAGGGILNLLQEAKAGFEKGYGGPIGGTSSDGGGTQNRSASGYTLSAAADIKRLETELIMRRKSAEEVRMGITVEADFAKGVAEKLLAETERNLAAARERHADELARDNRR